MTVLCPNCRKALRVPPDKQGLPGLKARCSGCSTVFVVAEASLALAPTVVPASAAATPPPAPAARAASTSPTPRPAPRPSPPPSSAPAAARSAAPRPPRAAGSAWRRCANHASSASQGICSECGKGWCAECVKTQGSAMICPSCDTLCLATAAKEAEEARARMRARPLTAELRTVFGYPLSDKVGFVLLAVIVGVASVAASIAAFGAGIGILFSQGLLYAYAFNAINKVSAGDMKTVMPNVGDITDLVEPLRGGLAAFLISTGPLMVLAFLHPPGEVLSSAGMSAPAALTGAPAPTPAPTIDPQLQSLIAEPAPAAGGDDAAEEDENGAEPAASADARASAAAEAAAYEAPGVPAWVFLAFALAIVWKILYSPVALVAAAISRGFFSTLNPVAGISAIRSMGATYWSAMGVYTAIVVVETVLVAVLGMIPLAGRFLGAFVQSYTYLAVGCLLGLAVFKKAPELGLD
jgi:predicted Zn finger-like uncharacterized protein